MHELQARKAEPGGLAEVGVPDGARERLWAALAHAQTVAGQPAGALTCPLCLMKHRGPDLYCRRGCAERAHPPANYDHRSGRGAVRRNQ